MEGRCWSRAPSGCQPGRVVSAVRYCRSGSVRVAFSVVGSGPVLLLDPGWVTHLRAQWTVDSFREFVSGLAARFTVVRFDKPGCGLSDRDVTGLPDAAGPSDVADGLDVAGGFDAQVDAALAVVDALPARRFSVFGASQGGQVAMALAARHPERVDSLVLFGTCADGGELAPPRIRRAVLDLVSAHWGLGSKLLADLFVPGGDPAQVEAFSRLQRASASAEVAAALLGVYYGTDVSGLLPLIRARTAVLHREGDVATSFDLGRRVAAGIPGAVLVPLAGQDHLFHRGDARSVLRATLDFLLPAGAATVRLTPRELSVSRLVVAGLTNQAIAAELGIAARTVDTHVENVRAKLGVRSRAQIAAWVVANAPPDP